MRNKEEGKRIISIAFSKEYKDEYHYLMQLDGNRSEWVRQAIREKLHRECEQGDLVLELEQRIRSIEESLRSKDVTIIHGCENMETERDLIEAIADFDF